MVSSVSGSSGASYVGILLSSLSGRGIAGAGNAASGSDTVFLSAQAQLLLSFVASLHASQGTTSSADELLSLATRLGPVVVTGDGAGPSIDITSLGPDGADSELNRLASLVRGEADPGSTASAGYFAAVRTGEGADAILAGDPTAAASDGLKALVDSGAGDDRVEVNGNALVRAGTGNDEIIANGGSLLVSFAVDDGNDSITLNDGASVGLLLGDVAQADLLVERQGSDLVLRIQNQNDSITIRNFQAAQQGYVKFGDGARTLAELTAGLNFTA